MLSLLLGSSLFALSQSATYGIEGSSDCMNYVTYAGYIYPVGECFQTQFGDNVTSDLTYDYSMAWMCESDGSGGYNAVQYKVGVNCDMTYKEATGLEYVCNGADMNQTCSCVSGATSSGCAMYMKTVYEIEFDWTNGFTCDLDRGTHYKYVTNMCVQNTWGWYPTSRRYRCVGYNYANEYFSDGYCGTGSPTSSPTMSPTTTTNTMDMSTTEYYDYSCTEYECNGVQGPRVDDGVAKYGLIGAVGAVLVSLLF